MKILPSIIDNDECTTSIHTCDHICVNNIGSFYCDCHPGYSLKPNLITCLGMHLHILRIIIIIMWVF